MLLIALYLSNSFNSEPLPVTKYFTAWFCCFYVSKWILLQYCFLSPCVEFLLFLTRNRLLWNFFLHSRSFCSSHSPLSGNSESSWALIPRLPSQDLKVCCKAPWQWLCNTLDDGDTNEWFFINSHFHTMTIFFSGYFVYIRHF